MAWLSGFSKRVEITIDSAKISAALSNFPLYIHLSDDCGTNAADISAIFDDLVSTTNKYKIAVTTSDGETQCYVEIDNMDFTNEEMGLHVKVPSISASAATTLYLYWDPAASDNTTYVGALGEAAAQAVWDSIFAAVYHMSQDPSGGTDCIKDSTSHGRDLDTVGSMVTEDLVDHAPNGKAIHFTGGQYCQKMYTDAFSTADYTQEVYMNPASVGVTNYGMFQWREGLSESYGCYIRQNSSNQSHAHGKPNNVNVNAYQGTVVVDTDQYFGHRRVGNATVAYLNLAGTNGNTKIGISYCEDWIRVGNGSNYDIMEARQSSNDRTPSWMNATYYTLSDNLISLSAPTVWLPGWAEDQRMSATIDYTKIDAALSDFPVMLKLSDASGLDAFDLSAIFDELGYTLTGDTFTGTDTDPPNADLWDLVVGAPSISTNKLRFSTATANEEVESHFRITGDFDIQVDLDLVTYPDTDYWNFSFRLWDEAEDDGVTLEERVESAQKMIKFFDATGGSWTERDSDNTSLTSTKFRFARSGSTITAYYWNGSDWTTSGTSTELTTEDVKVVMKCAKWGSNPTAVVDFDNFVITSGTVVWPAETFPNRKKIAVTESDGTTECKVEIERWDDTAEEAILWVKVPSISTSADTILYIYYDSDHANNTTNVGDIGDTPAQAVWDSDFVGVYHMAQDPAGGTLKDSTSLAKHLTVANMEVSDLIENADGIPGYDFGGTDERAYNADSAEQSLLTNFNFEAFYYLASRPSVLYDIFTKHASDNTDGWGFYVDNFGYPSLGFKEYILDWTKYQKKTSDYALGSHYCGCAFPGDGTDVDIVWDGVESTWTRTQNGGCLNGINDSGEGMKIAFGNCFHTATTYSVIKVYECRYSKTVRTVAWMIASYEAFIDNLITFDDAPAGGGGGGVIGVFSDIGIHSAIFGGQIVR